LEIDTAALDDLLLAGNVAIIDVREVHETPVLKRWEHQRIPLGTFMQNEIDFSSEHIVFICQSGKRSITAANWAKEKYKDRKFYSLKGGVLGQL
jgi:adenylyltransferase/sulfurtransferase